MSDQAPPVEGPMRYFTVGLAYLVGYVLLDFVSYVHPYATYGITPWNPQTGLSFALIILFGRVFLPWLFIAPFLADLVVRELPLPLPAEMLVVLITGAAYGGAGLLLRLPKLRVDPTLATRQSLLWLLAIAPISIAVVALGHGSVLLLYNIISPEDLAEVVARAFVGDLIGMIVFTPFLLIAFTVRSFPPLTWQLTAIGLLLVTSLWLIFGLPGVYQFQLFYLVLLPIVWVAMRFGLGGATLGLVATQASLMVALELSGQSTGDVVIYQALMVVLALTGLTIGMLVTEQRRIQYQLRLHQEALHRAARVGAIGEFAAAVAHEINQPLTAAANYSRLAKLATEQDPPNIDGAAKANADAVAQIERTGAVVRRLRDFIGQGQIEASAIPVSTLIGETLAICRPELDRHAIVCETRIDRELPPVRADRLQIEQVILNLLRNAAEALAHAGRHDGRIIIAAMRGPNETVTVSVRDNGPGLHPDLDEPISSFATTKREGLGLGLSLSRSIIEAHGGRLRIESTPNGVHAFFALSVVDDAGT